MLKYSYGDDEMKIYVNAITGNDKNNGEINTPLKSLEAARDLASAMSEKENVTVFLDGRFFLENTLTFSTEHSGKNGHTITYTSVSDKKAVITMAGEFKDFKLYDQNKNIWVTDIGKDTYSRQVYFNNIRGIRSRTLGYLKNAEYTDGTHYLCDNIELLDLKYPDEVDMIFHINWCNPRYMIDKIERTENNRVKITPKPYFLQHKGRIDFAGPARIDSTPGYLENAYEFLTEPGEWYIDKHEGMLYYIPREGEDMNTMCAKIPTGEWLIRGCGEKGNPLENLIFDNICFEGTTWLKVDRDGGFHDAQNGHIRERNGRMSDDPPGAAVHFEYCNNIKMTNNTFRQLGITGVEFMGGAKHIDFIGNELYDISGVAITVDDIGLTGFPENRNTDNYCEYVKVKNNYIHDVGRDYKSSAAVSLAWPRHSEFNHNEICSVPYSGFHIAYGWEEYAKTGSVLFDTEVSYNYVHDVFCDRVYDGGCIYTLGASSLECEKTNIEMNNRMWGNFIANSWTCAMIYPDEGSTSWYVRDNVIDTSRVKYLENNLETQQEKSPWAVHMHASTIMWMTFRNNFSTADYAYQYGWMNMLESDIEPIIPLKPKDWENWCDEAQTIIKQAGIEDEYKKNFNLDAPKVLVCDDRRQSLTLEKPTYAGFYVLGGKNKEYPISDYKLSLWLEDPEAVTLTHDGYYIAHKKGIFEGEVWATFAGKTFMHHVKLECGDELEKIALNTEKIRLIPDAQVNLTITAYSTFGNRKVVTSAAKYRLEPKDDIVSVDNKNGLCIKALKSSGETQIDGYIEYDGVKCDVSIPVKIVSQSSKDAENVSFKKVDLLANWKNPGKKTSNGGLKVWGSPNHNLKQLDSGFYAFDMEINPGSNWPAFTMCDSDAMGRYNSNDCYMFIFNNDNVELNRYNQGAKTVIFSSNGKSAISGPAASTEGVSAYNKRMSVVVGVESKENGNRIVLNINGKNIIDYFDDSSDRIPAFGYFVVYNPETDGGGVTFWEFSNIRK